MAIQEDERSGANTENDRTRWKFDQIGSALQAKRSSVSNATFGDGERFEFGENGRRKQLEIYPDSKLARVIMRGTQVLIMQAAPPVIHSTGIQFERRFDSDFEGTTLWRDGRVRTRTNPVRAIRGNH